MTEINTTAALLIFVIVSIAYTAYQKGYQNGFEEAAKLTSRALELYESLKGYRGERKD